MKNALRRRFDRAGASYESVALVQRDVAARLAGLCPEDLSGPILEIGAGSGLLTRRLAPRHTGGGPYVALDIAPGMMAHAAMPHAAKVAADGEMPPFVPGTFAFLASASTMQWYGNPERSIPADLGLVRPGGECALAIFVAGTLVELAEASRVTGFGSVFPMREAAAYRAILDGVSGLTCTMDVVRHTVVHPTVAHLLKSLKGAGVTHTPGARLPSATRYRAFTRYYTEHFGLPEGGVRASYTVAYFWGRLAR